MVSKTVSSSHHRRGGGGGGSATNITTPTIAKDQRPRPPLWKVWWTAARPHTLTASIAPNIVAYHAGVALWPQSVANFDATLFGHLTFRWTVFCVLMQLGTNLHNDYADFVKGADDDKRVGQARATQKGWLTPYQTACAATLVLLGGFLLGLSFVYQMWLNESTDYSALVIMMFIVVSSVFNAFAYTGGPYPLGYIGLVNVSIGDFGLGDLFVFLYFGLVATLTPSFLYWGVASSSITSKKPNSSRLFFDTALWRLVPHAIQVAVLATNIIVVNNLRDRHTDVLAAKKTLAVRFGPTFCRVEYKVNLLIAYGLQLWMAVSSSKTFNETVLAMLPLFSAPLAMKEWKAVRQNEGGSLNPHVGGAAKVQLAFCILLAISIRLCCGFESR